MSVRCKDCGYDNRSSAVFCGGCGKGLSSAIICPVCSTPNPPDYKHCDACGVVLGQLAGSREDEKPADKSKEKASIPSFVVKQFSLTAGWMEAIGISIIVVISFLLRLLRISDVPAGIAGVEAVYHRAVLSLQNNGWTGLWPDILEGQPSLYPRLLRIWESLMAEGITGLRGFSILAGTVSVPVCFLLYRKIAGSRTALIGAFLTAVVIGYLWYSRLATPVMLLPLAGAVVLLFLLFALDEKSNAHRQVLYLIASGIVFGIGFYLHNAFIIFGIAVVVMWLREAISGEYTLGTVGQRAAVFWTTTAVVLLPYFISLVSMSSGLAHWLDSVLVTSTDAYKQLDGVPDQSRFVLDNIVMAGEALVRDWGRHGLLDPVTAFLAGIGILSGIRKIGQRGIDYLLILLVVTIVVSGMTSEQGIFSRLILTLPPIVFFASMPISWLFQRIGWPVTGVRKAALPAVVLVFIIGYNLASLSAFNEGIVWSCFK